MQLDLQIGSRIDGKYIVKHMIGKGGMGAVYLVHHEVLGVDRALKIIAMDIGAIDGDDEEAAYNARLLKETLDRFNRETKTLARFAHKNIIYATDGGTIHTTQVTRSGKHDISYPYLVMEYVEGLDGKNWTLTNNPSLERIRSVCIQLAEGVACAHSANVLHRDLKPQNIIITADDTAKILDFGLAKDDQATSNLTQTGSSLGTLAFTAPEYMSASTRRRRHTPQTDIWGLGCCFYYFLTHTHVHPTTRDEDDMVFLQRIMSGQHVDVEMLRNDMSPEFADVINGMLQIDPAKRTASAALVVEQLRSLSTLHDDTQTPFVSPRARRAAVAATPTTALPQNQPTSDDELLFSSAPGDSSRRSSSGASSGNGVFTSKAPSSSSTDASLVDVPPLPAVGFASRVQPSAQTRQSPPSPASMAAEMDGLAAAFGAAAKAAVPNDDFAELNQLNAELENPAPYDGVGELQRIAHLAASNDAKSSAAPPAPKRDPGEKTLLAMLTAEADGSPAAVIGAAPAAQAPPTQAQTKPPSDYVDEDKPTPSQLSIVKPPPRYEVAATRPSPKELAAKKTMVLPAAIAAAIAFLGIAVFATFSLGGEAPKDATPPPDTTKIAADEKAASDAAKEMKALEDERRKAAADEKQRQAIVAAALANRPQVETQALPPPPTEALPPPAAAPVAPSGTKTSAPRPTQATGAAPAAAPASSSPWNRFGTYASTAGSTAAGSAPATAQSGGSRRAGTRIPVRVAVDLTSSPSGPVIAVVTQATDIGDMTLPAGTEIHGTTGGAQGTRLMINFTSAILNGANVSISGTALGTDGKAGVPGTPSGADGTDIAAGAANATVAALGAAATAAVGGVPGAAVAGATSPAASNTNRINTTQTTVSTKRGARFLVYVTR
jgi:serine/threonine protein kinase